MMNASRSQLRLLTFGACAFSALFASQTASAQSLGSTSIVGVTNSAISGYIGELGINSAADGSVTTATVNQSFTGLNGSGASQTMNFTGTTITQSNYGFLHSYATGTVSNTYYNASNPIYYNSNTNSVNPAGSPDGFCSLGFADFSDVLQYGGQLQAGYKAQYIFHVDGTNSGYGGAADLSVSIAGNQAENFFDFNNGAYSDDWVTQQYAVNGQTPQTINVQFSDQFTMNTFDFADGSTVSGTSDFSDTLTLVGIEMFDQNGNPVNGWTVSSASGTQYNAVPEPGSLAALFVGIGLVGFRRFRKVSN